MELRELLINYNTPDVDLADIIVEDVKQKRIVDFFIKNGFKNIRELKEMTDEDYYKLDKFREARYEKTAAFFADWYHNGFPVKNHIDVSDPETIMEELMEIFYRYKNMEIMASRENHQTYSEIADRFNKSRQSIQDREKYITGKFLKWYEENRINEKIGNFNDFYLYCKNNFPEDQIMMLTAVKRLVKLAKQEQK